MHIKYLEQKIDEDIAKIEARGGYKSMDEVRMLETELEVLRMLNDYKASKGPIAAVGMPGTVATR